jgi:dihydrolipoamide dehydrogenase
MEFDLAIIGAGPGGYVAALRAAGLGAKAALIENDNVGGTCLNRGCIPTKALAASAHVLRMARNNYEFGIYSGKQVSREAEKEDAFCIDFGKAQERKNTIVEELRKGIGQLIRGARIELIKGDASFIGKARIAVNGQAVEAKKIIIAAGSTWAELPNIKTDGKYIITSDEALSWNSVPKSLLIIGGGAIGCEFASIFFEFGSKITIVEAMPSILPPAEQGISRLLAKSFADRGIEIFTQTKAESAEVLGGQVTVRLSNGEERKVDRVLVSVGRKPSTKNLSLEKSGVILNERGAIPVNEKFETNVAGIYAIGDVTGKIMLAHAASAEGVSCVEQMYGKGAPVDYHAVPSPIFTSPEVAGVGLTSQELTRMKIPFKTGRFSYAASGKARCDSESEGMAMVHTDENGTILGAHFYGKDATLLVAEAALAVRHRLTARQVGATIHAHPTLAEVFAEAALDAVGEAVHKAYRKT